MSLHDDGPARWTPWGGSQTAAYRLVAQRYQSDGFRHNVFLGRDDTMGYDEVVAPAELRDALLDALRLTTSRRRAPAEPASHHGVLP